MALLTCHTTNTDKEREWRISIFTKTVNRNQITRINPVQIQKIKKVAVSDRVLNEETIYN